MFVCTYNILIRWRHHGCCFICCCCCCAVVFYIHISFGQSLFPQTLQMAQKCALLIQFNLTTTTMTTARLAWHVVMLHVVIIIISAGPSASSEKKPSLLASLLPRVSPSLVISFVFVSVCFVEGEAEGMKNAWLSPCLSQSAQFPSSHSPQQVASFSRNQYK